MNTPETGLDIGLVEAAMAGAVVGQRIVYRLRTGSTMDDARALAHGGAAEGTVVVAEEQGAGRGRFDRRWVSPPGLNLYFTILLRPEPSQLPSMNMAAALAVHGMASEATGLAVAVKWPNDVRIGGRKLGGILVETEFDGGRLAHALVGIGINVNLDVSEHAEISEIAASLRSATGREFEREEILALRFAGSTSCTLGSAPASRWRRSGAATLETLGKRVELRWGDRLLRGVAEGVDDAGNLILLQDDGERVSVVAGEVTSQL